MFSKLSFLSIHLVITCLVSVLVVTFFPGTGKAQSKLNLLAIREVERNA